MWTPLSEARAQRRVGLAVVAAALVALTVVLATRETMGTFVPALGAWGRMGAVRIWTGRAPWRLMGFLDEPTGGACCAGRARTTSSAICGSSSAPPRPRTPTTPGRGASRPRSRELCGRAPVPSFHQPSAHRRTPSDVARRLEQSGHVLPDEIEFTHSVAP
jgi:hypothetical protein